MLNSEKEIIETTLKNNRLFGRTIIRNEDKDLEAALEYSIKTININPYLNVFQVDTGPVLFPDLNSKSSRKIEWLRLAYIAYNTFKYTEFVLQTPKEISSGLWIKHYSEIKGLQVVNSVLCVPNTS